MFSIPIELGHSWGRSFTTKSVWNNLTEYGITKEDLKKLDLTFEELFTLYLALKNPSKNSELLYHIKQRINR